ncbi:MAG: hypothetical protein GY927_08265 [bacterium]|nr:hypothetical protein [bacterium]
MKKALLILPASLLSACGGNTLGALDVTEIGKEKGSVVYEAYSTTGRGWLSHNTPLFAGSAKFKAYKKLPADQQKMTDVEWRKAELTQLARKNAPPVIK